MKDLRITIMWDKKEVQNLEDLIRIKTEKFEEQNLSPLAKKSADSKGRIVFEEEDPFRTCFQRDRDRIIHCNAFRRLKHKTQVFLSPEGDHYRTRLTHTLEVSQIARTIARCLALNEDLTEAIALGHDLGHTPFGHAGERALDTCCPLGFKHYEQSVRVVDCLEKDGQGLNLTAEVKEGIMRHTCGEQASTLEGQIVRVSDKIAYINHDIDDAIRAGVMTEEDIPKEITDILGTRRSVRINTLVTSVVNNSGEKIYMDDDVHAAYTKLHTFMFEKVYRNPVAKGEEGKAVALVERLYDYFVKNPDALPDEFKQMLEKEGTARVVCDYIAGMTDRYAIQVYNDLFIPYSWK